MKTFLILMLINLKLSAFDTCTIENAQNSGGEFVLSNSVYANNEAAKAMIEKISNKALAQYKYDHFDKIVSFKYLVTEIIKNKVVYDSECNTERYLYSLYEDKVCLVSKVRSEFGCYTTCRIKYFTGCDYY